MRLILKGHEDQAVLRHCKGEGRSWKPLHDGLKLPSLMCAMIERLLRLLEPAAPRYGPWPQKSNLQGDGLDEANVQGAARAPLDSCLWRKPILSWPQRDGRVAPMWCISTMELLSQKNK